MHQKSSRNTDKFQVSFLREGQKPRNISVQQPEQKQRQLIQTCFGQHGNSATKEGKLGSIFHCTHLSSILYKYTYSFSTVSEKKCSGSHCRLDTEHRHTVCTNQHGWMFVCDIERGVVYPKAFVSSCISLSNEIHYSLYKSIKVHTHMRCLQSEGQVKLLAGLYNCLLLEEELEWQRY